ncbi:MAG TPA: SMI1/KNR4 family protein [Pseudonocardiaceae bacterium]
MGVNGGWTRLRNWLARYAPVTHEVLRDGATESDLQVLEQEIGVELPPDLREWWMACDGAQEGEFAEVLPPFYTPYSVVGALEAWRGHRKVWLDSWSAPQAAPEAGGPANSYHPAWVPLAFDGVGNDLVVDLRPGPLRGCVLEWDHEACRVEGPQWPGVAAMLEAVVYAVTTGTQLGHSLPTVTPDGRLDWRTR